MPPSFPPAVTPASHASVLALLVLMVALAYANSLQNGFTFDDEAIIGKNALLKQVHHWPTLLTSDYWAGARDPADASEIHVGLYRPLVLLSYAANYAVGGLNPIGYHLVNVLLHCLVVWLVYLLALQLGLPILSALAAAVLFAVHPIHTEAVSGIVGRAELMMAVGVLASLWWAMRGRYGLSLIAFAVGLFSKEQAVMLPLLLALYDVCVGGTFARGLAWHSAMRRLSLRYGMYALVLMGYLLVRWLALGTLSTPPAPFLDNPLAGLDWYPRLLTAIKVAGQYLWLCLWPASLSADYSYNAIPAANSLLDSGIVAALLAWLNLLAIAVWSFGRDRLACFCIGFLMVTFFPASNLIILIGTIMGERLFYLPSVGLCLLLAVGYESFARGNRTARTGGLILFSLLCLALLARTVARNEDWADTEQMARSAVRVVPNDAKVHSILGRLAKDKGNWDEAIGHFQTALSIYPEYSRIDVTLNSNLGISLIEKGLMAEGIEVLERAANIDPRWSLLHYNLGFAYARQGWDREAEVSYRQALSLNDEDPKAYTGLGFLFLKQGRYAEALASAEAALKRDPQYREALFVRARALEALPPHPPGCMPGFVKC
mgnify:CR=1 FL=1